MLRTKPLPVQTNTNSIQPVKKAKTDPKALALVEMASELGYQLTPRTRLCRSSSCSWRGGSCRARGRRCISP